MTDSSTIRVDFSEVKKGGVFKFVRVRNQYRFLDVENIHSEVVDEKNEKAETAGMIFVSDDCWEFMDTSSTSLQVEIDLRDEDNLTVLLERPYRKFSW